MEEGQGGGEGKGGGEGRRGREEGKGGGEGRRGKEEGEGGGEGRRGREEEQIYSFVYSPSHYSCSHAPAHPFHGHTSLLSSSLPKSSVYTMFTSGR